MAEKRTPSAAPLREQLPPWRPLLLKRPAKRSAVPLDITTT